MDVFIIKIYITMKENVSDEFLKFFDENYKQQYEEIIGFTSMNAINDEAKLLDLISSSFLIFCEEHELKLTTKEFLTTVITFSRGIFEDFDYEKKKKLIKKII